MILKRICIFLIFKIILFKIKCQKLLKIPFKTIYNTTEININNLIPTLYKSKIGTILKLGTPETEFKLSISLQSYYSYIISSDSDVKMDNLFNKKQSNTYEKIKNFQFYSLEPFHSGEFGLDYFKINNLNLNKTYFFVAKAIHNQYEDEIITPATLGLRLREEIPMQDFPNMTFLNQLEEKKIINNFIFYFNFNKKDEGELIFGENPYKDPNFKFIKAGKFQIGYIGLDWGFNFDNIYFGNITLNGEIDAKIKIEQNFIVGNTIFFDSIKNFFDNHNCQFKDCYIERYQIIKYYVCDSNTDFKDFKPLIFEIKEKNLSFVFNYKDLFFEYDKKLFFNVIFTKNRKDWVLGRVFLKKYQLYFDKDKKTIGYYEKKTDNTKILIILLIIIIILLTSIIILSYRKKRNKKISIELNDEYDYIQNNIVKINTNT